MLLPVVDIIMKRDKLVLVSALSCNSRVHHRDPINSFHAQLKGFLRCCPIVRSINLPLLHRHGRIDVNDFVEPLGQMQAAFRAGIAVDELQESVPFQNMLNRYCKITGRLGWVLFVYFLWSVFLKIVLCRQLPVIFIAGSVIREEIEDHGFALLGVSQGHWL